VEVVMGQLVEPKLEEGGANDDLIRGVMSVIAVGRIKISSNLYTESGTLEALSGAMMSAVHVIYQVGGVGAGGGGSGGGENGHLGATSTLTTLPPPSLLLLLLLLIL